MIEPKVDFRRYMEEVEKLLARNDEPRCAVVFYGSSTFTFWGHDKLKKDMAPIEAVNCGFGGSTAHDALHYYERLVKPLEPKTIVWYEGDNDLAVGYTPEEIFEITSVLFDKIREDFPGIRFVVISVKKSPSRKELWDDIEYYNEMIKKHSLGKSDITIMDMEKVTHCGKEKPREDIYLEDGLHFNEKGYTLLSVQIKKALLSPA